MPIKNFSIECEFDDHISKFTGGPQDKDGGFSVTVYQRSDGEEIIAAKVVGTVRDAEVLALDVWTPGSAIPINCNLVRLLTKR